MSRKILIALLAVLSVAQLAVPAGMIMRREAALSRGREYKIRVRPVDPYDAFRGRYIWLGMDTFTVPVPKGTPLAYGQKVYAILETDPEGFATVNSVSFTAPETGDYLKVRLHQYGGGGPGMTQVVLPFDRYYMEENAAPEAEKRFRQRGRSATAHITVRVLGGTSVISGLYLDGVPIERE